MFYEIGSLFSVGIRTLHPTTIDPRHHWGPLAKGKLLVEPTVVQISESIGRTPAQVLTRWSIQNGVITIPKSTKKERLLENFQVSMLTIIWM